MIKYLYGGKDMYSPKMKLTDEMKKYNTFKFLFLDDNNNFEIKEVHDVKLIIILADITYAIIFL